MPFLTSVFQICVIEFLKAAYQAYRSHLTELVLCGIVLKDMLNRANRPSGAWSACVCVELSERALQWNDLFQACSLNSTQTTTAAELQRDSARAAYNVAREQNDTERNNETVQTLAAQTLSRLSALLPKTSSIWGKPGVRLAYSRATPK